MATLITSATHGDSLSGSPEKRVDVAPDGTLWALVIQSSRARFFSSTNGGSTWSLNSASDLSLGSGQDTAVPSFFIDADGYAHVSFCRWQADPQVVIYARGTPRTGGGWSWTQKTIAPASGRTEVDSDVVVFRNGTGWVAWVSYGLNANGAKVAKVDISSTGIITIGATEHGPSLGTGGGYRFGGSLEFAHTGDGKTPTSSPDLFFVTAQQAASGIVYGHKATYSGGIWTWQTPVTIASGIQVPHTALCTVFDGTYDIVAWSTGSTSITVQEWNVATGTITARTPPALPGGSGNIRGLSLSHDSATDDIYLLAYGDTIGNIISCKFTRSSTSWGSWATVATRAASSGDGDVNAVRHPPRDSVDTLYSVGSSNPYTIYSAQVAALVRAPQPPTLVYPPNGSALDLAAGATFTWEYKPVSPGDVQQAYSFRRVQTTTLTTEFWNAGSGAWQAGVTSVLETEPFTAANGTAWDTARWPSGFGNGFSGSTIDVQSNRGRIITSGSNTRAGRRMNDLVDNVEITGLIQVSGTAEAQVYWRADTPVLNGYALVFSAAGGARVQRMQLGLITTAHTGFGPAITNGTDYRFRIQHVGGTLRIKVWAAAGAEPGPWQLDVNDTLFIAPGYVALAQWYASQTALFDEVEVSTIEGIFNATADARTEFAPGKWTTGDTYTWSVKTRSSTGSDSIFAPARTVTASVAPVVAVTSPSGLSFGSSTPLVEWTYTSIAAQRDYQVRIVPTSGVVIDPNDPLPATYDSGVVGSSIARSVRVTTPLTNDTSYRAYVRCTDINGLSSGWQYLDFTVAILPPSGPIVEAIDDLNDDTNVLRIRLDVSAQSNFLSLAQGQGQSGWDVDANCTLAAQLDDSSNQLLASLKLTSVAAGAVSAVSAVGVPPEAPYGEAALTRPLSFPVRENFPYTAVASFKSETVTRAARVKIRWYDDDDGTGALISESVSDQITCTNVAYTQAAATAVAPLGAKLARMVVEVLSTVAGGELFYAARMSLHPGLDTAWQPGGYSTTQTLRVERSLDGGTTWTTFEGRVKPDFYQQVMLHDRTFPFGTEVQYRAYTDVDPGGGAILTSAVSLTSLVQVDSEIWAIRDPNDEAGEFPAYVTGYDRSDEETIAVSRAAGREYPIVDSEGMQSGEGTLTLYVLPSQRTLVYDIITRGVTMVVQSPDGLLFLARFPKRDYQVTDVRSRVINVEYVEVESL